MRTTRPRERSRSPATPNGSLLWPPSTPTTRHRPTKLRSSPIWLLSAPAAPYIQGLLRQSAGQSHRQPEYCSPELPTWVRCAPFIRPATCPLSQITYCVPFAPDDPVLAAKLMYKVSEAYPEFYEEYEKQRGMSGAGRAMEPYKLYSKGPIEELAQPKGKKSLWAAVLHPRFQSIGAVPVNAAAADSYQTIKTGVASGSSFMTASTATTSSRRWKTTAFRSAWARATTMCSASTRTCGRVWTRRPSSSSRRR